MHCTCIFTSDKRKSALRVHSLLFYIISRQTNPEKHVARTFLQKKTSSFSRPNLRSLSSSSDRSSSCAALRRRSFPAPRRRSCPTPRRRSPPCSPALPPQLPPAPLPQLPPACLPKLPSSSKRSSISPATATLCSGCAGTAVGEPGGAGSGPPTTTSRPMSSQVSSSPSTTTVSSTPRSEGEILQSANIKSFAFTELIFSWLLLLLPPVAPAPCCRVRHSHRRPAGHAFKRLLTVPKSVGYDQRTR
ncbi:putative protein TPRXL [Triticum aestivum]|uniref:putative protein TPRXL n=1 Tax=Triticum aestivum TaxID=4565 RepID=UPI001D0231A4|nr:putative protein TPRXL [Triticum aestivum]